MLGPTHPVAVWRLVAFIGRGPSGGKLPAPGRHLWGVAESGFEEGEDCAVSHSTIFCTLVFLEGAFLIHLCIDWVGVEL